MSGIKVSSFAQDGPLSYWTFLAPASFSSPLKLALPKPAVSASTAIVNFCSIPCYRCRNLESFGQYLLNPDAYWYHSRESKHRTPELKCANVFCQWVFASMLKYFLSSSRFYSFSGFSFCSECVLSVIVSHSCKTSKEGHQGQSCLLSLAGKQSSVYSSCYCQGNPGLIPTQVWVLVSRRGITLHICEISKAAS